MPVSTARELALIGDIGGTNARFALVDVVTGAIGSVYSMQCSDFADVGAGISAFLSTRNCEAPVAVCLGAAGPVRDGEVRLTNNDWSISERELRASFPGRPVHVLNDFEALAWSIEGLASGDTLTVGNVQGRDLNAGDFTIGILGPGTGLGVAAVCRRRGQSVHVSGEGGHVGFAPVGERQIEILSQLQKRLERVSNEHVLSGSGIENVYAALSRDSSETLRVNQIFERAKSGVDPTAVEALDLFFEVLGQVAGDIALVFGATDGVYLAGGILPRYPELIAQSPFRQRFELKGPHRVLMSKVPTLLITHRAPGLLGAARYILDELCSVQTGH